MRRSYFFLLSILFFMLALPLRAEELSEQQRALHVLNRLAYGPKPGDVEHVMQIGVEQYIKEQLNPERIPLSQSLTQQLAKLTTSQLPAADLIARYRDFQKIVKQDAEQGKQEQHQFVQQLAEQTASARLAQSIISPHQLEEVMVDFWFNHFNVFEGKGLDRVLIASYEREAIRPYALGRFRDLLGATAKSPAMLFYLDNWLSVAPGFQPLGRAAEKQKANGLNENYARELMELHTLGTDGGYTQKDVTELARIFTGWTFDPRSGSFTYVDRRHDQGSKEWLNRHINPRGQAEGEYALDVLASHPATAHHISYQLAQYFVADQPPPALVEKLAQRFLQTDGNIRSVLDTLFHSPEFWDPANYAKKFKTPYQYVISTVRAADVSVANYRPLLGILHQQGMPLYGCQTPDGYKNTEEAWLNPDALSRRINFATALATGRLPFDMPIESNNMDSKIDHALRQTANQDQSRIPVDAQKLMMTLNGQLSDKTRDAVTNAEPRLQAALMLGSPDFMRH
jgi:uncharacterized protein (DUF1800 family)